MRILACLVLVAACASKPAPATPNQPAPTLMVAGDYKRGGDCAHGTPENPTCTESLTLKTDGTGTYIGDDIVEDITWKQDGNRVIISHGQRTFGLDGWTRK